MRRQGRWQKCSRFFFFFTLHSASISPGHLFSIIFPFVWSLHLGVILRNAGPIFCGCSFLAAHHAFQPPTPSFLQTSVNDPLFQSNYLTRKPESWNCNSQRWDFSDVDWALMLMCAEITTDNYSIQSEAPNSQKHFFDTLFHAVKMQMSG